MSDGTFTRAELEAALNRAFVGQGLDSILVDGQVMTNPFLRKGIFYGVNQGWLEVDSQVEESQYGASIYVLTDSGKRHFGLTVQKE